MGGGILSNLKSDVSSASQDSESTLSREDWSPSLNLKNGLNFGGCKDESVTEACAKQRLKVWNEVADTYNNLNSRMRRLEETKARVLSYTPRSWIEKTDGLNLCKYILPKTTSLILVGPKGSGKSCLVNKISAVLEGEEFGFGRAQVSYNPSIGDGTHFLHEYMIPQNSSSFCLYDTRSLSDDISENEEMLEKWMVEGVRHGELVKRRSDSSCIEVQLRAKARKQSMSGLRRQVNFVIFVVNAIDVLKAMSGEHEEQKHCSEVMTKAFNYPYMSFKDDKPVVVVTHGDLLSVSDRVNIRLYLGDLLHVHPAKQIFDIPDGDVLYTKLTVVDMLNYCLDRAVRNLPRDDAQHLKAQLVLIYFLLAMMVISLLALNYYCPRSGYRKNFSRLPRSTYFSRRV